MKYKKLITLSLIYTFWLSLSAPFGQSQTGDYILQQNVSQPETKGLDFRLREASEQPEKRKTSQPAATVDLSETETNAILRRLPGLNAEASEKANFNLPSGSLPPPKTGNIVAAKFPSDESQNIPNTAFGNPSALNVAGFSPEGNVSTMLSDLSITFSQPMIAVASQSQASENVPVILTPQPKGRWRWLGTRTLIFDAESRFPMATKFTARIPAGTKSTTGGVLQKEVSWSFSTPPVKVESFVPNGETVRRDAFLIANFNQEINAEAVLQKINAAANDQKILLCLATENEISADKDISEKIRDLPPKEIIVFRAAELLPPDSQISITFESGMQSAEGDLPTTDSQSYSFKTFGALKYTKSYCGYDENEKNCESQNALQIRFSNPLDGKNFDKSQVKIEPNIEDAEISVFGNEIAIQGYKKPRSTYKVTVAGTIKDKFEQTLGNDFSTNFKIEAHEASLFSQGADFIVLDPNAKPRFSVYSTNYENLKVKIYRVRAEDYQAFKEFQSDDDDELPAFGKLVFDESIPVKSERDEQAETRIDISPALTGNLGHAVIIIEPPVAKSEDKNQRVVAWLEATQIGIDAFADYEKLTVFASDLKNGKPLKNVRISLSNGAAGITNTSGTTELKLPATGENKKALLIARRGEDSAILFEEGYDDESDWTGKNSQDSLRWFVFNDRNMYRTGETVSIKGYLRRITGGKFTDVGGLADGAKGLSYVLKDSRGIEILKGKANLNSFGSFDFELQLPDNINLGEQSLELTADSALEEKEFTHNFQVQEFRRPEFEVTANVEAPAPFYVGGFSSLSVEAKYYSGGFLPAAATNWKVTAAPAKYAPPNRDDFTFGKFFPWWRDDYEGDYDETTSREFKGKTNVNGKHLISIDFLSANPSRPYTISAEASVKDVNLQTFSSTTGLLVHPSELYVGLRTPKTFVRANEQFKVETITTDIDGKSVQNAPVFIVAELKDWEQIKGEWEEVTVDIQKCQIKSQVNTVSCSFTAKQGGTYQIKATVLDNSRRPNESELIVWAAGGKTEPKREVEQEDAQLIPDRKDYSPEDTAEILVNAPFFPAEGVMTLRRNGIIKTERFTMNEASTVLRIPIEERYLPNIHVQVDLIGSAQRIAYEDARDAKLPKRPAFAIGELNLNITTASRKLNVTAEPVIKTLKPGGATTVNISVKNYKGNPVADSEVALVAVDESVLALTNYKIPDPADVFYQQIESGTIDYHSREKILLAYPDDLKLGVGYGSGNGIGDGMGGGGGGGRMMYSAQPLPVKGRIPDLDSPFTFDDDESPISIRKNFYALATFAPTVKTDENGKAIVKVKLPDNLTRYRITAVAVTNSNQFGSAESSLTAKQPLMVRPSAPRFMNFGDRAALPVVIQNQTDNALTVNVAVRAANAALTNRNGKRLVVPPNDRAEVRFDVVADKTGTARFQIGATSGKLADAAEIELPVYTPATNETFATYGTTDQNGAVVQPVEAPGDVYAQFGGLEVTTSSTQLQELTDAFIYLQSYPFECSEQISSRILSVTALRDVLTAFEAKDLPSKSEIEAKMKSDIERLQKLQHSDGGFSFWRGDDESLPFVSVHAAHALGRADLNGYAVPADVIAKARVYLQNIESKYPSSYSQESRWAISAYALYVRDLFGDKDTEKTKRLLQDASPEKLSPESLAWLLSVLANDGNSAADVDLIKRHLLNRVTETAGAANFITNYKDGEYVLLASERRADGVILEALLTADPDNDLIPKIVRGLLAHKTKGRWSNTQENVFILLALGKYFKTYERVTPDFVAKVWLGEAYAGEQNFKSRSTDSSSINVPMKYLQDHKGVSNLILDKQGSGRLYYRIGLNYAPKNLQLDAADYGFAITRTYEAVDDAGDVKQNADGSWTIKAGARVRVELQMVAPTRRYHVALIDKLPAGFEIINPELAVSGSSPKEAKDERAVMPYAYRPVWFEHQNLRDERAEAFTSLLKEGVWSYSYVARATTPGNFTAPPAKAEEMYAPETFGRTSTDFVKVE